MGLAQSREPERIRRETHKGEHRSCQGVQAILSLLKGPTYQAKIASMDERILSSIAIFDTFQVT